MGPMSRESKIGLAVSALTVTAMAIDHLIGTEDEAGDDPGLADPAAFLISVAPERAARKAIACALLAVPAMALLFLGLPFPLAGAAIALGLIARDGSRSRIAAAAVVVGALVIALGAGAYVVALVV